MAGATPRVAGRSRRSLPVVSRHGGASSPLPPISVATLRRGARPGSRRPGPPQRRARRPRVARLPVQRAARHGQDVDGPHPREGAELPERDRRRAVRRVRGLPGDRARHVVRRLRARRGVEQRRRQHPRAQRARCARHRGPAQGVHPRRGPHALEGRIERAPEDARGSARARRVRARDDRPAEGREDDQQPHAAPAVPPAAGRDSRRAHRAHREGREPRPSDRRARVRASRRRGSARDTLSALDQVVAAGSIPDDGPSVEDLVDALADRDAGPCTRGRRRGGRGRHRGARPHRASHRVAARHVPRRDGTRCRRAVRGLAGSGR